MPDTSNKPLVINNFQGGLTRYLYGDINSGRSWVQTSSGQNPFVKPNQLTWNDKPIQIDPDSSVITDLIMGARGRAEGNILYMYAIGHTGRLYKIQVNDPTTYNPNYDNPVLLTTLTAQTPTFKYGGSIDFFGSTERIYIGHDKGVTRVDFAGTNETFVGTLGSWTQNVPRPLKQFTGKLYAGNGNNLAEINDGGTVLTYSKITPAFPANTQVRDIDLSVDGTYMETVVSRLALYDLTSTTQESSSTSNSESYIIKWNGVDAAATSITTFPSFSLGANILFQNYQYTFGTDQFGSATYNPVEKIMDVSEGPSPLPNAITSTGNLLLSMSSLSFDGVLEADLIGWGSFNFEVGHPVGYWGLMFLNSKSPETDILRVPCFTPVSNTGLGSSSNGYNNNLFSSSKFYFSTLETSASTTAYRLYKWAMNTVSPTISIEGTPIEGVYQTQTQMFHKKSAIGEIRIYSEPWVEGNSFLLELIGSTGDTMTNGSYTFTAGSTLTIGNDFAWWVPETNLTYCLGIRITNLGTKNFTINKIEIDYSAGGK